MRMPAPGGRLKKRVLEKSSPKEGSKRVLQASSLTEFLERVLEESSPESSS